MQFNIDLGKSFDRVVFVKEKDKAEKMVSKGWTPIWDPYANTPEGLQLSDVSSYFILVFDTTRGK
ncbi:hypothetical protein [Aneurinibacillus aneurinilyticus]|uniref:hypothetical protein n=1 Tax=Aneurinibacillus aneurinilyticus TaxID=1391 RepID=UPI0023F18241|nr:hypothetical protein [Aneurinibacillus aneurinilyticus]